ncbi:MAG: zinc ribbon domain-containing protein [Nitrospirae bacterium]|nr:MAG: zinc ribbon domain-containing protein [Nitrospirota bacterium]
MPLYEYICQTCSHHFEMLVQGATVPECPSCRSKTVQKQLSVFAVTGSEPQGVGEIPGPCSTCGDPRGPGACALDS